MTTASRELFELCKRVYDLTGWVGTNKTIVIPNTPNKIATIEDAKSYERFGYGVTRSGFEFYPLYTSDYLLEKLPRHYGEGWANPINISGDKVYNGHGGKDSWVVCYEHTVMSAWSDTPLKALLKLTLKLHEEEV